VNASQYETIRLGFTRKGDGKGEILAYVHGQEVTQFTVGEYHQSGPGAWTAFLWTTAGDRSVIAATLTAEDVAGLRAKADKRGRWWK